MPAPSPKDYYQLFGISRDASAAELHSAYRHLAEKYAPERHPDYPLAEERFQYIHTAYKILADPTQRAAYDAGTPLPKTAPKVDTDALVMLGILVFTFILIVVGFARVLSPLFPASTSLARYPSTSNPYTFEKSTPYPTITPITPIPSNTPSPLPTEIEGPIQAIPIPQKLIIAGTDYFCMLTSASAVKCWGNNQYGQLGDGTQINRSTPVDVYGLSDRVSSLTSSGPYTCATLKNKSLRCWGITDPNTPINLATLNTTVVSIAAGINHTCILTNRGAVKCWGDNGSKQLGNAHIENYSPAPVYVDGLQTGVTAIAAGSYYTCALLKTGNVKCWGENLFSELGINDPNIEKALPSDVPVLGGDIIAIAAGYTHTCALNKTGNIRCWGSNNAGQLGIGQFDPDPHHTAPITEVVGLDGNAQTIQINGDTTCSQMKTGHFKCWGMVTGLVENNFSATPLDVTEWAALDESIQSIVWGNDAACLRLSGDRVKCWGNNKYGQLGDDSTKNSVTPVDVIGLNAENTAP